MKNPREKQSLFMHNLFGYYTMLEFGPESIFGYKSRAKKKMPTSWATKRKDEKAQFALIFCQKSSVVPSVILCWVKAYSGKW